MAPGGAKKCQNLAKLARFWPDFRASAKIPVLGTGLADFRVFFGPKKVKNPEVSQVCSEFQAIFKKSPKIQGKLAIPLGF